MGTILDFPGEPEAQLPCDVEASPAAIDRAHIDRRAHLLARGMFPSPDPRLAMERRAELARAMKPRRKP